MIRESQVAIIVTMITVAVALVALEYESINESEKDTVKNYKYDVFTDSTEITKTPKQEYVNNKELVPVPYKQNTYRWDCEGSYFENDDDCVEFWEMLLRNEDGFYSGVIQTNGTKINSGKLGGISMTLISLCNIENGDFNFVKHTNGDLGWECLH